MIKEFWIYKITNIITNKFYIGQTNNLYNRLKSHKACRDKGTIIVKSIQKYGWENHKVDVLFSSYNITRHEADELEKYYIKYLNSYIINNTLGMNLTEGGYGGKSYKKRTAHNPKKWKIKLGKENIDIVLLDMQGEFVDRFDGIDFNSFIKRNGIIVKNFNTIKRSLYQKLWAIVNNKFIIGFEDIDPYKKHLELLKHRSVEGKKYKISQSVIDNLNKHREENQQVPILDLNTGVFFETMTEFCLQEKRAFSTIRERFEKGYYEGKYLMCKN